MAARNRIPCRRPFRLVGGLVGGDVGGLVGRLVGGDVGGLVGGDVGGLVGGDVGRLVEGQVEGLVGGLVGQRCFIHNRRYRYHPIEHFVDPTGFLLPATEQIAVTGSWNLYQRRRLIILFFK
jgi:uncharacterized protein YcfJ